MIERIIKLSKKENKTNEQMLLKLSEEVGEVSQAYLSMAHASGSDYKDKNEKDYQEELVDSLMMISTLLVKSGISKEELLNLLEKKCNKWESKQNN